MECNKIEILLEKYFQGETTIVEEKELRTYFSSSDVATHLEQYKPLFVYFSETKEEKSREVLPEFKTVRSKKRSFTGMYIAASVLVLLGIGTYVFNRDNPVSEKRELGTYDDPKVAFKETQKALALLSIHVNTGIESVQLIHEYDNSKGKIFNQ